MFTVKGEITYDSMPTKGCLIMDNSFNVIVQMAETGARGLPGIPGKDGYTPIKGIDYFDGEKRR